MMVLRQLPKNSKIINAVRQPATRPSLSTLLIAAFTNTDWSNNSEIWISGLAARTDGRMALMPSTTSSVDAEPAFRITNCAERLPSLRTILLCTPNPSRVLATSRRYTMEPLTALIGRSFISSMDCGLLFNPTTYSRSPTLSVPVGNCRFCAPIAVLMSVKVMPFAIIACGSVSTMICRGLPP